MLMQKKGLLIGGAVVTVLLVLLGGSLAFRGGPVSEVTVRSIPEDLTLTLDGHQIAANGTVKVKEGSHTLVAERDGFEGSTQTVEVSGGDPLRVKMYLYANGDAGREWVKEHPDQALEAEGEAGKRFDELGELLAAKYPIIQELPYIGPGFKVTYGSSQAEPDNSEKIALYIKLLRPEGKAKALEWMKGHGYDPAQYELIYTK
ncbi:MAG TPA: PEGA domain-containing protein [Kribbella sp.]|uniref:PEGA domain-containing protein n=1 Tax=Kribbella sp. TaxID=1871183 RepID=UPI002D78FB5E|nr:PEGA domain-containing protein [Kribbella sp.]HET6293740.1 PEGA domain-containing protein [Kribbella sp.]